MSLDFFWFGWLLLSGILRKTAGDGRAPVTDQRSSKTLSSLQWRSKELILLLAPRKYNTLFCVVYIRTGRAWGRSDFRKFILRT